MGSGIPIAITLPLECPAPQHPNTTHAAVMQFVNHGIYGWPKLGGGYFSVYDWERSENERWKQLQDSN